MRVWISAIQEDRSLAIALAADLRREGVSVYTGEAIEPGGVFTEHVAHMIAQCDVVVYIARTIKRSVSAFLEIAAAMSSAASYSRPAFLPVVIGKIRSLPGGLATSIAIRFKDTADFLTHMWRAVDEVIRIGKVPSRQFCASTLQSAWTELKNDGLALDAERLVHEDETPMESMRVVEAMVVVSVVVLLLCTAATIVWQLAAPGSRTPDYLQVLLLSSGAASIFLVVFGSALSRRVRSRAVS